MGFHLHRLASAAAACRRGSAKTFALAPAPTKTLLFPARRQSITTAADPADVAVGYPRQHPARRRDRGRRRRVAGADGAPARVAPVHLPARLPGPPHATELPVRARHGPLGPAPPLRDPRRAAHPRRRRPPGRHAAVHVLARRRPALLRPRRRHGLRAPPPGPGLAGARRAPGAPRPPRLPRRRRPLRGRRAPAAHRQRHGHPPPYYSDVGEWVQKSVHYPLPPRPLAPLRTLALHGRLWWADYSWGVITADPFADHPVLSFVPLPSPCVLHSREAWGVLDQVRYIGVSAGNLRFVDTYRRGGAPNKVSVWTLPHPYATEWMLEHEATFADIWADDTYKATGLPKKIPVLALIHPHNPAVVYFFLEDYLFAVDVPARKVVECDRYHLVAPPRDYEIANRFVRAWELPRAVSSGLVNWSSDIGSSEPTKALPSTKMPGDYHLVGNMRMKFIG